MKILNIMSRYNVGGTAQWLYQLSTGLTKNNITNRMLVGNCPEGELEDERISYINHRKIAGLGPGTNLATTLIAFFKIRDEIKKFRPDIVNTHTSKAGVIGRLAAKSVRPTPKVVHTYHGHVFYGYFNPILEFAIKSLERILSQFTDTFFVLGDKVLEDLLKLHLVNTSNSHQVLPGVADPEKLDKYEARAQLGIKDGTFVVGWLGRKVPIKRIDRTLDLAELNPNITFLLAGVGPKVTETYKDRFSNGNLSNVIEVGYATPSQVWSASDICLITSDNEGIPTSSIEAALFEIPVVSTDAGSIRDVVVDEETGFICESNIDSLSEAIRKLKNDPKLTKEMGIDARKIALMKFSPESSVLSQINGYEKTLGGI
jgi:glycosyltransferase involved in cell wall biosynthesis